MSSSGVVINIPNKQQYEISFDKLKQAFDGLKTYNQDLIDEKNDLVKKISALRQIDKFDDAVFAMKQFPTIEMDIRTFNTRHIPKITADNQINIHLLTELRDKIKSEIQSTKAQKAAEDAKRAQDAAAATAAATAAAEDRKKAEVLAAAALQEAQRQISELITTLDQQQKDITENKLEEFSFDVFQDMIKRIDDEVINRQGISESTKDKGSLLKRNITDDSESQQRNETEIKREFETLKKKEIETISTKIDELRRASTGGDIKSMKLLLSPTSSIASSKMTAPLKSSIQVKNAHNELCASIRTKIGEHEKNITSIREQVGVDMRDSQHINELDEILGKLEDTHGNITYVSDPQNLSTTIADMDNSPIQLVLDSELEKAQHEDDPIKLKLSLNHAKRGIEYFNKKLEDIDKKLIEISSDKQVEIKTRIHNLKLKQNEYNDRYGSQLARLTQMNEAAAAKPSAPSGPQSNSSGPIRRRRFKELVGAPEAEAEAAEVPAEAVASNLRPPSPQQNPDSVSFIRRKAYSKNLPVEPSPTSTPSVFSDDESGEEADKFSTKIQDKSRPHIKIEQKSRTGLFIPISDDGTDSLYLVDINDEQSAGGKHSTRKKWRQRGGEVPNLMSSNVTIRKLQLSMEDTLKILPSLNPNVDVMKNAELLERLHTAEIVNKADLSELFIKNMKDNLIVSDSITSFSIANKAVFKSSILKLINILDSRHQSKKVHKTYTEMYENLWKYFKKTDGSVGVLLSLFNMDDHPQSVQPPPAASTSSAADITSSKSSSVLRSQTKKVAPITLPKKIDTKFDSVSLTKIVGWENDQHNGLLDLVFNGFETNCHGVKTTFLTQRTATKGNTRYRFMLNWIILLAFNVYARNKVGIESVGELITNIYLSFLGWMPDNRDTFEGMFDSSRSPMSKQSTQTYKDNVTTKISSDIHNDVTLMPLIHEIHTIICELGDEKQPVVGERTPFTHRTRRVIGPPQTQPLTEEESLELITREGVAHPEVPKLKLNGADGTHFKKLLNSPKGAMFTTGSNIEGSSVPFDGTNLDFKKSRQLLQPLSARSVQPLSARRYSGIPGGVTNQSHSIANRTVKLNTTPRYNPLGGGKRTRKHKIHSTHSGRTRRHNTKPPCEIGHKYTRKHTRT